MRASRIDDSAEAIMRRHSRSLRLRLRWMIVAVAVVATMAVVERALFDLAVSHVRSDGDSLVGEAVTVCVILNVVFLWPLRLVGAVALRDGMNKGQPSRRKGMHVASYRPRIGTRHAMGDLTLERVLGRSGADRAARPTTLEADPFGRFIRRRRLDP